MCFYSSVQNFMKKISIFGVDFDQYFYVRIDFELNTQIENISQNRPPKLISFGEMLHTAVYGLNKYEFIW